ncbi:SDR family NAD(P)-dependent oxidoreductase [Falsigemmobacter faecalis]|uniref:SDR family NAD(P)-dependent oxidoreductase n=1 Tax=Falsigemmobacter faecalis TaxID=2488730 RepID=A0A3P3DU10_9RHOB|nr:SDR family NAD(P)-dependent oxidoreductase [Falsigemmobacter faecalis]RRH76188.1 SDR family NAD(P)-dependent oxidoreductase [Falsigemmobacter faecalis]
MLNEKVVIVTGAGGGIGRALALECAKSGARVVVNDIGASLSGEPGDPGAAEAVAAEICAAGGAAMVSTHSVTDPGAVQDMVRGAVQQFGRLDGVINNAGILRDTFFHKMSYDAFDAVIKVHLYGSFNVSRAAAAVFKDQGSGAFVHMTSTSALIGNFGQANYMAAKLAIAALSKSIALDMQRFGVTSNCIAPFAWSRMTSSLPTETAEQIARVEKFKQMVPEKIAPLAIALLSGRASVPSGQIFTLRNNEIMLMSQPRPLRSVHRAEGWTPETVLDHALPAMAAQFYPLDRSENVFTWDPI